MWLAQHANSKTLHGKAESSNMPGMRLSLDHRVPDPQNNYKKRYKKELQMIPHLLSMSLRFRDCGVFPCIYNLGGVSDPRRCCLGPSTVYLLFLLAAPFTNAGASTCTKVASVSNCVKGQLTRPTPERNPLFVCSSVLGCIITPAITLTGTVTSTSTKVIVKLYTFEELVCN